MSKKRGGSWDKKLGRFNRVLLGKWVLRFLLYKNSLWSKVLRSRHGDLIIKNGKYCSRKG